MGIVFNRSRHFNFSGSLEISLCCSPIDGFASHALKEAGILQSIILINIRGKLYSYSTTKLVHVLSEDKLGQVRSHLIQLHSGSLYRQVRRLFKIYPKGAAALCSLDRDFPSFIYTSVRPCTRRWKENLSLYVYL